MISKYRKTLLLSVLVAPLLFTGCSQDAPKGSVADYQSSQMSSKNNCQSNADDYIAAGGLKEKVVMDSDSSITRQYLQGDGWCSGNLIRNGKVIKDKIYCRSNKGGGCKPVKPSEDGEPNPNLDHSVPVPK